MDLFDSAEKGCMDFLIPNTLSSYSKEDISKAINIAIENGNTDYFEKLTEIQNKIYPIITTTITPSPLEVSASSLIVKEFVNPITAKKCPHGSTVGHQIMERCNGGYVDYCCGNGRAGGGWCRRCGGTGYIDYDCIHRYVKSHTYIAGFCNGP